MAFWRFGFHSQSAIDAILSSSAANNSHPAGGCLTPSSTAILLDKLLDEDDLLQEIKAQHPKLIEFLATNQVVLRILGYISGLIFDDEEADRIEEDDRSAINHLSHQHSPSASSSFSDPLPSPGMGGAILNSIRNHGVGDKISALLMDALDSEGRTPEDRAKAEKRKVRFPYLCSEIVAAGIWNVTAQIFSDAPHYQILTRFWDSILDQPPSVTAHKSIQIGHWARTNIVLINTKPNEMITFLKSYPGLIPKLVSHFNSSPVVDVLFRIIQTEATNPGVIDWLVDETDFVELIVSFLHPSRPAELHLAVAEFLKNIIGFCTTSPAPASPPQATMPHQPGPNNPHSSITPQSPEAIHPSNLATDKVPDPQGGFTDDRPTFITIRLMRELASSNVVSKLLSFGLDTEIQQDESLITNESITSSLVNALSILIDLIRRNNSDFSESQILLHLRDLEQQQQQKNSSPTTTTRPVCEKSSGPAIVPLMDLLDSISSRLPDLQQLIKTPHSSTKPIKTTVGAVTPLTLERFRIMELYAELLHCSNMTMLNRAPFTGPVYDEHGHLLSGLEELIAVFSPATAESDSLPRSNESGNRPVTEGSVGSEVQGSEIDGSLTSQKFHHDINLPHTDVTIETGIESLPTSNSLTTSTTFLSNPSSSSSSGARLKQKFIEYKILDTCFDLFFDFPWNNFLHNVVFDIVQQTLNAKFLLNHHDSIHSNLGSQVSFELVKSLFDDTRIVERILEGVEINHTYGLISNNVRLGNMAHLILIADETSKVIESNPQIFSFITDRLSKNEAWQNFISTTVSTSRIHNCTPLGGTLPPQPLPHQQQQQHSGQQQQHKLSIDGESLPSSQSNKHGWTISSDPLTKDLSGGTGDLKVEENVENNDDDDDDPWSTGRRKTGGSDHHHSVISNPTPFGFDDRFDAPSRSFPTRFGSSDQEDDDDDELDGFGDDFGPFSDASAIHQVPIYDPFTLTTPSSSSSTSTSTPKPTTTVSTSKPTNISISKPISPTLTKTSPTEVKKNIVGGSSLGTSHWAKERAGEGEGDEEEEEEWGDFAAGNGPGIRSVGQDQEEEEFRVRAPEQDIWTDFDLGASSEEFVEGSHHQQQQHPQARSKRKTRSRAGSASSSTEPYGPGVRAESVRSIRDDGKVEVRLDDGSLVIVPADEVMSAIVSHDQKDNGS